MTIPTVQQIDPRHPDFAQITRTLDAYHDSLYPAECNSRLSPEQMTGERVFVYGVIDEQNRILACGALDARSQAYPELKRFYTHPEHRSKGYAGRILDTIIQKARELALTEIYLETGNRQPRALTLYRKYGFTETGRFGVYEENGFSVFMKKSL